MGKVNVCVKRSYVVVISLIAITALLLLGVTLFSHGYLHKDEELDEMLAGLHAMYAIAVVTLILTIIGVFGACKEKKWALIVFTVGIILSSLFLFAIEIQALALQPEIAEELEAQYLHMLPLSNASEAVVDSLNDVQRELHCCGLSQGYLDWEYNIPESCLCDEKSTTPCVEAPRNSHLSEERVGDQPIMIYSEACLPHIIKNVMGAVQTVVGILLGVTLLLVLSVVLCIIILCQLNRKEDTHAVVYSTEAKAGNYTTLAEPPECT